MLNDSAQRPPQLGIHTHSSHSQTPHSSYDVRIDHTPGSDVSSSRPTPYAYGPPSQSSESRAQGGGSAGTPGNGSYFALQSPHPNTSTSASTPSAGPHSAYAQSPIAFMGTHTPRESALTSNAAGLPHNAAFVSPTPTHQPIPPTPGSVQHQQHNYSRSTSYNNIIYPTSHSQFRSPPTQVNGLPSSNARHSSPIQPYQSQPATPLGPPIHHPKASPHSYRPSSQGHEAHIRRASQSSISSVLSNRDYPQYPSTIPTESSRGESVSKANPYDSRDRERSISVSPKTIPRPPPPRDHEQARTSSLDRSSIPPQSEPVARPMVSHQNSLDPQPASTPDSQFAPPNVSMYNSPQASRSSEQPMQQSYDSMNIKSEGAALNLVTNRQQLSLKRRASHLSDTVAKPPQKKPRRSDIPIWARSARQKPVRFVEGRVAREPAPAQQVPHPTPQAQQAPPLRSNGSSAIPQPVAVLQPRSRPQTIAGRERRDPVTPIICEWVSQFIGRTDPPPGSKFEIEAKLGVILRNDTDSRYESDNLAEGPLREGPAHNTKFHSGMSLDEHRMLNESTLR